jgi:Leucine-rich repeat (LRR) protein
VFTVNKISTLPADLDKLSNLDRLDLSNNRLTRLEAPIAALGNLRTLILNNNPLSTLYGTVYEYITKAFIIVDVSAFQFAKLPNLIELNMNECQLEKISQDIGTLTKLQTLELGINKLKVIPRQIGTRFFVRIVFLSLEKLTEVENSVKNRIKAGATSSRRISAKLY